VEVIEPILDHFEFGAIGNQSTGTPFSVSIRAKDQYGFVVPSFTNAVPLAGYFNVVNTNLQVGSGWDPVNLWTTSSGYPLYVDYPMYRAQVIYHDDDLGGAGFIGSLALNVQQTPGMDFENWTIRLRHTDLENYNSSGNWETNWMTVYQGMLSVSSEGWLQLDFETPFEYNGTNNLMIDFSFSGENSHWNSGYCEATNTYQSRILTYGSWGGDGEPLDWSSTTPGGNKSTTIPVVKLGFVRGDAVVITPTNTTAFVDGVWFGSVTVSDEVTNMVLQVNDGVGHYGYSDFFTVFYYVFDSDEDGIGDLWETVYFGDPALCDPNGNADNDGHSNLQEYITGMNPTNSGSFFSVAGPASLGPDGYVISWNSVSGRVYNVHWSTNLMSGFDSFNVEIYPPQNTYTDTLHNAESEVFYKLDVQQQ